MAEPTKRKRGRPPLGPLAKSGRVVLLVTEDNKAALELAAEKLKLSASEYVASLLDWNTIQKAANE